MSRGRSGLLSLSPGTTPCQCAMSRWEPCRSTRGAGIAGGRHASDRHLVARRTKRRTHLCQRPSITANARPESSYARSRGCSGGSCNRQYRSCRCKGCGAGSNLAQSTKRDVGSALGVRWFGPATISRHGSCGHLSAGRGRGSHRKGSARAPVSSTTRRIAGSG
jgi:hypothetical protein